MKRTALLMVFLFTGAACPASAAVYRLDPKASTVTFLSITNLHSFEGRSAALESEVDADAATGAVHTPATIKIDAMSFVTGNTPRDHSVQYTLAAARYPHIQFTLERMEPLADKGSYEARGTLTVAGRSTHVDFSVHVTAGPDRLKADAKRIPLKISDFSLKTPKLSSLMGLHDEVYVDFHTEWERRP